MRVRYWVLLAAALVAVAAVGCTSRVARAPINTPVPTKTLRPTFTATVPEPTLTPTPETQSGGQEAATGGQEAATGSQVSSPTPEPPTPTAPPPTEAPSPTPEEAAFTVTSASINVRSGPGTVFPVLGRLSQGASFPITGKDENGDWWQFDYNGKTGWVIASNVSAAGSDTVLVAKNIPRPPTAAPRPTARPAAPRPAAAAPAPQPAQPAPAASKFAISKSELRTNTNPIVSVWCFVLGPGKSSRVPGTLRVLQGGSVVKEQPFSAVKAIGDSGYSSEYLYNDGCKVELPAADGTYTAYLIEGGNQISDAYTFTVSGESNRTAIVEWTQR